MIKSHTVCPTCGYYDGKQVLTIEAKKETAKKDEAKKAVKEKAPKTPKAEPKTKPTKAVKEKSKLAIEAGKKGDK